MLFSGADLSALVCEASDLAPKEPIAENEIPSQEQAFRAFVQKNQVLGVAQRLRKLRKDEEYVRQSCQLVKQVHFSSCFLLSLSNTSYFSRCCSSICLFVYVSFCGCYCCCFSND